MDFWERYHWAHIPRLPGSRGRACRCACLYVSMCVSAFLCSACWFVYVFTYLFCVLFPFWIKREKGAFCTDSRNLRCHQTHPCVAHTHTHSCAPTHTHTHTHPHTHTHAHTQPLTTSMLYICSQFLRPEPNMIWIYIAELHGAVPQ